MLPPTPPEQGDMKAAIVQKILQLLQAASSIAQQNGIDFGPVLEQFLSGGQAGPSPSGPPPPPPMMG